jgi:hypothetical protein
VTTRLSELEIPDVSLVKRAANGRRRFLILKADGQGETMDDVKVLKTIEAIDKAGMGPELEALAGADPVELSIVAKQATDLPADDQRRLRAAFRVLGKPLIEKFVGLVTPPAPPAGTPVPGVPGVVRKADGSYDLSGIPETARPAVELVLKARDADVAAFEKRLAKQEKDTADIRDKAERERFITVVKEFSTLPGATPDDLAPALREISEKAPTAYAAVMKVLKAADALIDELDVEGVVGTNDEGGTGSASQQIAKLAKTKVEKAGGKLSEADAIVEVARENPQLYRQHQDEVRAGNGGATA